MSDSTTREKENKLMQWWIERMPETKEIFDNCIKYYAPDESLGLYNFMGDLIVVIYDKAIKQHNDKILIKFLTTYSDCINEFKGQFLYNKSEDSLITIAYTDIFEGTSSNDYNYILNLMPEGILKEEFKKIISRS